MREWLAELESDEALSPVVREVLSRDIFRNELLKTIEGGPKPDPRKLRQHAMGIWLNMVNTAALTEEGTLAIKIEGDRLILDPSLDESEFFVRQAILRQTERYWVAKENGLFERSWSAILDVGAGGLALEASLRAENPNARILAFEPGLVTEKTRRIARVLNVDLRAKELTADLEVGSFDLALLHFVLEHDLDEARHLISQTSKRLSPGGMLSIAVPNFDAKHRKLDLEKNLNDRDPKTRLSIHDRLSGHEILFTKTQLQGLIQSALAEQSGNYVLSIQSTLPRESAFNGMAARGEHRKLLELANLSQPKDEEDQGSVLVATVQING